MQSSSNVAFLINSLEGGGAERVMCKLLSIMESYFAQQGTSVHLILLDAIEEAHSCPAYVNKITLDTGGSLKQGYAQLKDTLAQLNPDFCLSFLTRSNMLNIAISKKLGYRPIISERVNTSSHFPGGLKDSISKLMIKFSYPYADTVIAVSEGVKADLIKNFRVPEHKLTVLYNPYDIAQIEALAAEPVDDIPARSYIIGTGRLVKNKNFSLMLEAFAKSDLQDDLMILGQGDEYDALVAQAKALGVSNRVHFAGFKANPYPYLKHARFFVSTSNAEGFPNAIVEAMCLGKAVVATNCESGPAEILSEQYPLQVDSFQAQKHGCICDTNNVGGVVKALNYMNVEKHLNDYAAKSAARAQSFSNEIFREKVIATISSDQQQNGEAYVSAG